MAFSETSNSAGFSETHYAAYCYANCCQVTHDNYVSGVPAHTNIQKLNHLSVTFLSGEILAEPMTHDLCARLVVILLPQSPFVSPLGRRSLSDTSQTEGD